jgi:hypothetical protein
MSLFTICMFCQRELYVTRPADKESLTGFYIVIATGSFLGSVLVTWVAPLLFFNSPLEYLLGLSVIPLALIIKKAKPAIKVIELRWVVYVLLVLIFWPRFFRAYNIFGIAMLYLVLRGAFGQLKEKSRLLFVAMVSIMFIAVFTINTWSMRGRQVYALRNYYGIYSVNHLGNLLIFFSGDTLHGTQFLSREAENEPLSYFHRDTPVGKLLESKNFNF